MLITIKRLSTSYFRAQGNGPCEWAQWPCGEPLSDEHFFVQASDRFRAALFKMLSPKETE